MSNPRDQEQQMLQQQMMQQDPMLQQQMAQQYPYGPGPMMQGQQNKGGITETMKNNKWWIIIAIIIIAFLIYWFCYRKTTDQITLKNSGTKNGTRNGPVNVSLERKMY